MKHKQWQAVLMLLASLALSTVLGIGKPFHNALYVSSFGTEGFPFDSCGPASPVKVCSALGAKVKETSAIR